MIKIWPDEILTKHCPEVTEFNDTIINTLDEMKVELEDQKGMGLAAPQIGALNKMFIMKLTNNDIIEVINPVIIEQIGTQYELEGCLSFNSVKVKISRPKYIHAKWQDRTGERKEGVFADYEAVCFAHENDHLYGRTILNHLNRQQRKEVLKELES